MDWIAKGKISVGWQIVFSFIPGVLIWSFFRIKKLRLFVLTMAGPAVAAIYAIPLILDMPDYYERCTSFFNVIVDESCFIQEVIILSIVVNVIYHGFKTYYIIKWTRKSNESFSDQIER